MKRTRIPQGLFAAGLLVLSGCSPQTAEPAAPETKSVPAVVDDTQEKRAAYSAALEDAFTRYEAEVGEASQVTYHSEVELDTVRDSLSEERFDFHLRAALAAKKLSVDGLAEFALGNPGFFHAEQRRHWGRLAEAQDRLAQLQVQPGVQLALAGE